MPLLTRDCLPSSSPVKGPKATGRRAAAAVAAGNIAATGKALAAAAELDDGQLVSCPLALQVPFPSLRRRLIVLFCYSQPNNDYCETCGGKGHFLCCDGCPRSFHFTCLDPPLDLDEVPTESWYCKVCEAARVSSELIIDRHELAHSSFPAETADTPERPARTSGDESRIGEPHMF